MNSPLLLSKQCRCLNSCSRQREAWQRFEFVVRLQCNINAWAHHIHFKQTKYVKMCIVVSALNPWLCSMDQFPVCSPIKFDRILFLFSTAHVWECCSWDARHRDRWCGYVTKSIFCPYCIRNVCKYIQHCMNTWNGKFALYDCFVIIFFSFIVSYVSWIFYVCTKIWAYLRSD